ESAGLLAVAGVGVVAVGVLGTAAAAGVHRAAGGFGAAIDGARDAVVAHSTRSATRAVGARIRRRASEPVVAGRSIRLVRIRAKPRRRSAGTRVVALVRRRAHDGGPRDAGARLTGVVLGAAVAVATCRTVRLRGIRTDTAAASANVVAL